MDAIFSSRGTYVDYLQRIYGFHAGWEPRLHAAAKQWPELVPFPARLAQLEADLQTFDVDASTLPVCASPPAFASGDHAAGALYVIEGSSLGGAVLARMARRRLGVTPLAGGAFFAGGPDLGARWRLVVAALDRHAPTAVVSGATETFRSMQAWLLGDRPSEHHATR